MALVITRNADELGEQAREFLEAGVERNVLATVFQGAREGQALGPEPPLFGFHIGPHGQVSAMALRTPPWPFLAAGFADPDLAAELVRQWLEHDPALPGVSAEPPTARAISAAWARSTGGVAQCDFVEAIHVLTEVTAPRRPASGRLRTARSGDHDLLTRWEHDFATETGTGTGEHAERIVRRRTAAGRQVVWEDAGECVCTVGFNIEVAGTVRIGPVFTPADRRGHGYATSAVAATSRLLLDRGARRCMLFTDVANPISNHVYASIGYVRCGDWEQHGFHAPNLPN